MYTLQATDSISAIDASEWDELAADVPFTQHRWLQLAEAVIAGIEPLYLVVRRDGRPVAAAAGVLERRTRNPVLNERIGWVLKRSPILRIGVPIVAASGLLVRTPEDLPALLGAVERHARHLRVLFHTIDHLSEPDTPAVLRSGLRLMPMTPDARLRVEWPSFEEYVAALPRKKRAEVGRTLRRAADAGITVAPLAVPEPAALYALVTNVLQRYGEPLRYDPELFSRAAELLGDDMTVMAAYRDGVPVACTTLLRCGDVVAARWMGRDYERTEGTMVYAALVAGWVRHTITVGARELRFGSTAMTTKKHFGVTVVERRQHFATRGPLLNWAADVVRRRVPVS